MKIFKRRTEYKPLIIQADKPFQEMTKKEADAYSEWFLSKIDERSEYLREIVSEGLHIDIKQLDFTLDSTLLIWKWFLKEAKLAKTPESELDKIREGLRGMPQSFIDHMVEMARVELSIRTEYILRDIGMYLGKMFISNYENLRWTIKYKPKSYIYVNVPIIVGFVDDKPEYPKPFHPDLEPIDFARLPAMKIFEGTQKESDLYEKCKEWISLIPPIADKG